jgi:hypothetical protein
MVCSKRFSMKKKKTSVVKEPPAGGITVREIAGLLNHMLALLEKTVEPEDMRKIRDKAGEQIRRKLEMDYETFADIFWPIGKKGRGH